MRYHIQGTVALGAATDGVNAMTLKAFGAGGKVSLTWSAD